MYQHSTNFPHLTGDALEVAKKHHIRLEHLDYVQIHPTTLYSEKPGRRFLISESVRGEGALLYNKNMERFVDELLTASARRGDQGNPGTDGKGWNEFCVAVHGADRERDDIESFSEYLRALPGGRL